MELTALIIHPDASDSRLLSNFLKGRLMADCMTFENETEAVKWVSERERPVDIVFVSGDAVKSNEKFLDSLRELDACRFSTIFLIVSEEDKEWTQLFSSTGEVIDNLLIKPFRVSELVEKVRKAKLGAMTKVPSLLVVEKEPDDRNLLRESVSGLGFTNVYEARDGAEALETINQKGSEISVIVSGWDLVGMNGIQFLRKVRQIPKFQMVPFLLVATQTSIEEVKTLHHADSGIQGYLSRPFDAKNFAVQMEALIQRIEKQHKVGQFLRETKMFESRGTTSHAIDLLHHAVKTLPDAAAIYEALGDIYRISAESQQDKNFLTQAVEAYEKAIKLEPARATSVTKCIEVYLAMGRSKDVIRVTKAYLYRFGFDDVLRTQLGKIYLQSGDYGAACVELRRALSVNPFNSEAQSLIQVANDLQKGSSGKAA